MPGFKPFAIDGLYPVAEGGEGLRRALEEVRAKVSAAIADGAKLIVLSDRYSSASWRRSRRCCSRRRCTTT